jgi:tetratricopeptide (TPR) repeat protein
VKKLFEDLRQRLSGFIEQRDHAFMVVSCVDAETVYCVKTLESIEQADSPHAFWVVAHDFEGAAAYVEQTVQAVVARVDALRKQIAESDEPLPMPPELPDAVRSERDPVERLKQLMIYTRVLADAPEHCVVWGLFPMRVADAAGYVRFVHALLQHEWPMPWCHHMRIFVREDKVVPYVSKHLKDAPRTDWYSIDFGPEMLEQSLVDQAADESESPELRMQAYLMLAAIDYGHRRYTQAMEKYRILAAYYQKTGNAPMLALCLNGMGEVFMRNQDFASAKKYFESALTPAIAAKQSGLAVLINISLNLGNLHLEQKDFATAIEYYEGVAGLATATNNAQLKLQVRETQGSCHLALGQHREAWERWQEGVTLARALADDVYQERLLQRLIALYESLGMSEQLYRTQAELRILKERGPEALKPLAGVQVGKA